MEEGSTSKNKMADLLKVKIRPVGNIWLFEDGIGKATKIGDNFRKNYILVKKFVMCNKKMHATPNPA